MWLSVSNQGFLLSAVEFTKIPYNLKIKAWNSSQCETLSTVYFGTTNASMKITLQLCNIQVFGGFYFMEKSFSRDHDKKLGFCFNVIYMERYRFSSFIIFFL